MVRGRTIMGIDIFNEWCRRAFSTLGRHGWKSLLSVALVASATNLSVAEGRGQNWPEGRTYELKGLRVTLSAPVLMARRKSYFWFPKIMRLTNGELLAQVQVD